MKVHLHTHMLPNSGPCSAPLWSQLKLYFGLHISVFCSVLLQSCKPPPCLAPQPLPPATSCFIFLHYSGVDLERRGAEREKEGKQRQKRLYLSVFFPSIDLRDQLLKPRETSLFWFKLASGERATVGHPRADTHDKWTQMRSQNRRRLFQSELWHPEAMQHFVGSSMPSCAMSRSSGASTPL